MSKIKRRNNQIQVLDFEEGLNRLIESKSSLTRYGDG